MEVQEQVTEARPGSRTNVHGAYVPDAKTREAEARIGAGVAAVFEPDGTLEGWSRPPAGNRIGRTTVADADYLEDELTAELERLYGASDTGEAAQQRIDDRAVEKAGDAVSEILAGALLAEAVKAADAREDEARDRAVVRIQAVADERRRWLDA